MLRIMSDMNICVGSDGYNFSYDRTITCTDPHPRSFGTFPRFLRLVREHELMPLEDAVYKITGLPAQILGLTDRGILRYLILLCSILRPYGTVLNLRIQ